MKCVGHTTNQSGIARGYYTEEQFTELNDWMIKELADNGVKIDAVYYCPHHPEAKVEKYHAVCNCRKPATGMYERAVADFDLDLSKCYAIGDKIRDCSICETTECRGVLIGENEKAELVEDVKRGLYRGVAWAKDLRGAAEMVAKTDSEGAVTPIIIKRNARR